MEQPTDIERTSIEKHSPAPIASVRGDYTKPRDQKEKETMNTQLVVRQSSIGTYLNCPRSWYLQYVRSGLGLEKIEEDVNSNADTGTKVHKRLEARYKDQPEPVFEPGDETLLSKLMVDGYVQWVADTGADFGERQEFIERRISLPIPDMDIEVSCQLDRLVFDEITEEYIVDDFKTVASLGVNMLEVNQQLLTYVLAVEASGFPCRRGRITQLKRSKRTAKATPPFYERFEIYVTDEMKQNHLRHLRATLGNMVRDLDMLNPWLSGENHHDVVYPVPSRDCSWRCPFVSVCPSMDDGSDWEGELAENFKPRTEHFKETDE